MLRRELLPLVRATPEETSGLRLVSGVEAGGIITRGVCRSPETGETYRVKNGYLDLLRKASGAGNIANLTNYLPGAGRAYEPLWRVRSLDLLTGEPFPNEKEVDLVAGLAGLAGLEHDTDSGTYLDIGCSAGLYTRVLQEKLGDRGAVVGIDISPSMLGEAARRIRRLDPDTYPSLVRADAGNLPFADGAFAGAVCGGTLNEIPDPARVLRETHRALVPGGRLVVMGILEAASTRGRYLQRLAATGGVNFFSPEGLESLFGETGFALQGLQTYGAVFFAAATSSS